MSYLWTRVEEVLTGPPPGSDLLGPPRPRPPSAGALLEHAALGPARADGAGGRPIAAPQLGIEPCPGARREKLAEYLK